MRYSAQTLFYDTRDWHRVAELLKLLLQIMSDHEETVAEAQEREAAAFQARLEESRARMAESQRRARAEGRESTPERLAREMFMGKFGF